MRAAPPKQGRTAPVKLISQIAKTRALVGGCETPAADDEQHSRAPLPTRLLSGSSVSAAGLRSR